MSKRMAILCISFCSLLFLGINQLAYADNAEVLPKRVFMPQIKSTYYLPHTHQYDEDGNVEEIASDFNGSVDSSVFPPLAALDPFVVGPPASIGDSDVDMEISRLEFEFSLGYGLLDKLSVGVNIPYLYLKNKVDFRLDNSTANVGTSVLANSLAPLSGPFAPPDVQPVTTEDAQAILGPGLDINGDGTPEIPGLGFERLETWSDWGLGDIEAGLKFQYFSAKDWRLASGFAVRFPTGEVNDPDHLSDLNFGDGTYDLLFRLYNDYIGFKNLVLDVTLKYDLQLPDKEEKRVLSDVDQPLAPEANKEKVDRDLGDIFEVEVSGVYEFLEGFAASLLYGYAYKWEDKISGDRGLNYDSLEEETEMYEHVVKTGLSFSTIPWYRKKEFPLPLRVFFEYRNKFAGKNVLKSQYISLAITAFF